MNQAQPKIIVLDDDPTGSQTVHSCLLLLKWDVETLKSGLQDQIPIIFILSNTRALNPQKAAATTKEICQNLKSAISEVGVKDFLVVSRSDSTLRGHYPIETDTIAQELGGFDAHFLTPAFFEGGRITTDSTHYLLIDNIKTPVAQTEFAQDSVFGYSHSYLPDYVEEKTQGQITAKDVIKFSLTDIRTGEIDQPLLELQENQCVVVDGETQADFDLFASSILKTTAQGKRFLFRSAASLLTSLAQLGDQPTPVDKMAKSTGKSGVVLVGSHVQKTTEQLHKLLAEENVVGIEIEVTQIRDQPDAKKSILSSTLLQIHKAFEQGKTPVIYTSRKELSFENIEQRLRFGAEVSSFMMSVVQGLPNDLSFLISKGGITSNDVLSIGLELTSARLLGQIIPGCSVIKTAVDHPQFPDLPVVLFPGNVGNRSSLVEAWSRLRIL